MASGFYSCQNTAVLTEQTSSPAQLNFDRFVTGPTIQSIFLPASVFSNQQATLTITLNAPAPSGGMNVGLTSFSNLLLFPNSTQGMVLNIPEGQTGATVQMSAQSSASGTIVHVLAIQNGVRCNAAILLQGS